MSDDAERARSFDRKAAQYDRVRPSYPDAIVEAVLARSGARRLLEIGAGTGKATAVFARHGCNITALEPGAQLAAILRANVPSATVVESRFEDYAAIGFDLIYAAQAFHWVDRETRCQRAAAAASWLAILSNETVGMDPKLRAELDAAYARWLPDTTVAVDVDHTCSEYTAELAASGCFAPAHVERVPWTATYTRDDYLALIDTYSQHALMPATDQAHLYAAIAAAIDRHGGTLEIPYVTLAFVAAALR